MFGEVSLLRNIIYRRERSLFGSYCRCRKESKIGNLSMENGKILRKICIKKNSQYICTTEEAKIR